MNQPSTFSESKPPTIRVGTDIVAVERMTKSVARESFLNKVFHPKEIAYCKSKSVSGPSFAARFAAKEAFLKALGTGLYARGMGPLDVWIEHDSQGRPKLMISEAARSELELLGTVDGWDVSLAHEAQFAIATVVIRFK